MHNLSEWKMTIAARVIKQFERILEQCDTVIDQRICYCLPLDHHQSTPLALLFYIPSSYQCNHLLMQN